MVATAPIRAGSAFVEIFLKDGKLEAGLRGAQQKLQKFALMVLPKLRPIRKSTR